MQACHVGYLRQRAGSITRFPLTTSALFISTTAPVQLRSALTLNRFRAVLANSDDPQDDSKAPWANVKLAGILVRRIDSISAGANAARHSTGIMGAYARLISKSDPCVRSDLTPSHSCGRRTAEPHLRATQRIAVLSAVLRRR